MSILIFLILPGLCSEIYCQYWKFIYSLRHICYRFSVLAVNFGMQPDIIAYAHAPYILNFDFTEQVLATTLHTLKSVIRISNISLLCIYLKIMDRFHNSIEKKSVPN